MAEESKNRVMVTEETTMRVKTDAEIVAENEALAEALKTKKQAKIEALLKEREDAKKKKVQEESMTVMMVEPKKDRAINFGVVGVGQCGGKIAKCFYDRGYTSVAINTAMQDLQTLLIPERNKLFLDSGLGGCGKDIYTGQVVAEQFSDDIGKMLSDNFSNHDAIILALSGGGGTGAGSAETMVNLIAKMGTNIIVLFVLPLMSEDGLSKSNAVQTLSKLANLTKTGAISSLFVLDNSRIQMLNSDLSMSGFWDFANDEIVNPLHVFNSLTAKPSSYVSLDPTDFSRVILGGQIPADCAIYGTIKVNNYLEEDAIAVAIVSSLEGTLLCSDFNLGDARTAGIIITGNKNTLSNLPAAYLEYGFGMLPKITNEGIVVYRGIYETNEEKDGITIYTMLSGMGLPRARVDELLHDATKQAEVLKIKEGSRTSSLDVNIGKTSTTNASDNLFKKIQSKNTPMGKILDKRRR